MSPASEDAHPLCQQVYPAVLSNRLDDVCLHLRPAKSAEQQQPLALIRMRSCLSMMQTDLAAVDEMTYLYSSLPLVALNMITLGKGAFMSHSRCLSLGLKPAQRY